MTQLSRSAGLTGFADLARTLGLDPHRLAAAARVPAAALTDPDLKIPSAAVGDLLELAARRSGWEDFGLRLAEKRRLSNMGTLALTAREQPDLRRALEVMGQHLWMQNESLSLHIEDAGEAVVLRLVLLGGGAAFRQSVDLCVAVLYRNLRALTAERWRPQAVCFSYARPASLDTHRRLFGATPLFDQPFDGLICAAEDLEAPIPGADPAMAAQVARYVDQLASAHSKSHRAEVTELITLLLPTGLGGSQRIARQLGIDRRTLQRRLASEGVTFRELLDAVRGELARAHLAQSNRPLSAIADLLGFSSPSAFAHWFRASFGLSATAWRDARRAAPPTRR